MRPGTAPAALERLGQENVALVDVGVWPERLGVLGGQVRRLELRLDGRTAKGTAFLVGPDLCPTNQHVVAPLAEGRAQPSDLRDDDRGGNLAGGSGPVGPTDRVEALGGSLSLRSPPGAGTRVQIALCLAGPGR